MKPTTNSKMAMRSSSSPRFTEVDTSCLDHTDELPRPQSMESHDPAIPELQVMIAESPNYNDSEYHDHHTDGESRIHIDFDMSR